MLLSGAIPTQFWAKWAQNTFQSVSPEQTVAPIFKNKASFFQNQEVNPVNFSNVKINVQPGL